MSISLNGRVWVCRLFLRIVHERCPAICMRRGSSTQRASSVSCRAIAVASCTCRVQCCCAPNCSVCWSSCATLSLLAAFTLMVSAAEWTRSGRRRRARPQRRSARRVCAHWCAAASTAAASRAAARASSCPKCAISSSTSSWRAPCRAHSSSSYSFTTRRMPSNLLLAHQSPMYSYSIPAQC